MIAGYQTFPIHNDTFNGTATAEPQRAEHLVKALADQTLTFAFPSGEIEFDVLNGFDCVLSSDCSNITSTDAILLS